MAGGPKRVQSEPRGFSVPGADGLTEEEAREALEDAEKRTKEALEKIANLTAMVDAIGSQMHAPEMVLEGDTEGDPKSEEEPKKQEPLRGVSALITIVTVVLIICNSKGWITFTTEEQTAILGALAILGNEVARMHVTASPKS